MTTKQYVSDQQVRGLTNEILRQMAVDGWRPDYVVGLTRGGLTPALMISHYLKVPMETLKINLRDGAGDCESNAWMPEDAFGYLEGGLRQWSEQSSDPGLRKKILVVDDINDNGATLNWLMSDWQSSCMPNQDQTWEQIWGDNVRFAVLYDNLASQCRVSTHYAGQEINRAEEDCWIVFPWENWWEAR